MNENYKTKFGHVKLMEDKILISDNSNVQFFWIKAMLILNLVTAILNITSRGIDKSIFFYIWISISFISIFVFIALLRLTHKKELSINEIQSVKFIKRFNNLVLSFRLKNKRIRRVYLLKNQENNNDFMAQLKTTFDFEE